MRFPSHHTHCRWRGLWPTCVTGTHTTCHPDWWKHRSDVSSIHVYRPLNPSLGTLVRSSGWRGAGLGLPLSPVQAGTQPDTAQPAESPQFPRVSGRRRYRTWAWRVAICFSRFRLASSSSSSCSLKEFFSSSICFSLVLRLSFCRFSSWSSSYTKDKGGARARGQTGARSREDPETPWIQGRSWAPPPSLPVCPAAGTPGRRSPW